MDPNARVNIEAAIKTGSIMILGDVSIDKSRVDFEAIARKVCEDVGFTSQAVGLDARNCTCSVDI